MLKMGYHEISMNMNGIKNIYPLRNKLTYVTSAEINSFHKGGCWRSYKYEDLVL